MVYITGDTHGDISWFKNPKLKRLGEKDILIVCGDFGFLWDSPAFIEDDIFDAMLLGEVDVVLVGVVVDAGAEVHPVEVPSVPPVPSDFSRLHPAEILRWIGRLAKLPDHIINSQIGITR